MYNHIKNYRTLYLALVIVFVGRYIQYGATSSETQNHTPTLIDTGYNKLQQEYYDLKQEKYDIIDKFESLKQKITKFEECKSCNNIVWFFDDNKIQSGYVVLWDPNNVRQGITGGSYWIITNEHYSDIEYIGFDWILPVSYVYKTKKELEKYLESL